MSTDSLTSPHRATGPVTPEGKAISSRNSFKHGVYSHYRVFRTDEETEQHDRIADGFLESWNPVGEAERANVYTLAWCQFWRLKFRVQEAALWTSESGDAPPVSENDEREKELNRRKRSINSEYNKAYRELTHLQRIRRQEAAAQAKLAQQQNRARNKANQEKQDRKTGTGAGPQKSAAEFVSATSETPPGSSV